LHELSRNRSLQETTALQSRARAWGVQGHGDPGCTTSSKSDALRSARSHLACFPAINKPTGDPAAAADNGTLWPSPNQIK